MRGNRLLAGTTPVTRKPSTKWSASDQSGQRSSLSSTSIVAGRATPAMTRTSGCMRDQHCSSSPSHSVAS
eukprot:1107190-Heterocapsa_arctica.AAC.1